MKLIHTSPAAITEINSFGRFGEFLFFADDEYVMTAGDHIAYSIELDAGKIIEAGQLFYHEEADLLDALLKKVMEMTGCDEDTGQELIAQNEDVHSIDCDIASEDLAEVSWDIQRITGEAAIILGFRGVAMQDEQGVAYLVHMKGREADLEAA